MAGGTTMSTDTAPGGTYHYDGIAGNEAAELRVIIGQQALQIGALEAELAALRGTDTAPGERLGAESKAIEHLREAVEQNDTLYVIVFRQAVADALAELADLRGELAVSNQAHDWAMRELAAALNERDDLRGVLAGLVAVLPPVSTPNANREGISIGHACTLSD